MKYLTEVRNKDGLLLALKVSADFHPSKPVNFLTQPEMTQQVAYMQRPTGEKIPAHIHKPILRTVQGTPETLLIRSGKVWANFYDVDGTYLCSQVLGPGDVLLLLNGGHGFEILEEAEIIEVKQGPYAGAEDKTLIDS